MKEPSLGQRGLSSNASAQALVVSRKRRVVFPVEGSAAFRSRYVCSRFCPCHTTRRESGDHETRTTRKSVGSYPAASTQRGSPCAASTTPRRTSGFGSPASG